MNTGVFLMGFCQLLAFSIFPSKMKGKEPDNPGSRDAGRIEIPRFCIVLAETRAVEDGPSMLAINLGTSGAHLADGFPQYLEHKAHLVGKAPGWERGLESQSGLQMPGS